MSCASPTLQTTTTSSDAGKTAIASGEKASCMLTKMSFPEMRCAFDGASETSQMTCGRSELTGFGASHGERWTGSVCSLGGQHSTGVHDGCELESSRPPADIAIG